MSNNKSNYSEKLKDPKWQRLRLKVFERDNWKCHYCGNEKMTLHVHHKYYENGKEPWEYSLEALVTLCEDCHSEETYRRQEVENSLLFIFKKHFSFRSIIDLCEFFESFKFMHVETIVVFALGFSMANKGAQCNMIHYFIKHLKKNNMYENFVKVIKDWGQEELFNKFNEDLDSFILAQGKVHDDPGTKIPGDQSGSNDMCKT